jgi:hypothetical protein
MSDLGTYSFMPWLRQGLAGQITAADNDPSVKTRASVHVKLGIAGERVAGTQPPAGDSVERDVQLYGPGDIVGIREHVVVRAEPRGLTMDFEPNYLAHIEFYDEGLPWRYTPAAPDPSGLRLRPWITLAVLEKKPGDDPAPEYRNGENVLGKPLPYIDVANLALLPPADALWAWAHVHVNTDLAAGPGQFSTEDMTPVLPRLQGVLNANPDRAHSRLICPRRLQPNRAYEAFLIPTFETGRLAGLNLDLGLAPHATHSAWATYANRPASASIPYYYRWEFRTGEEGDFEELVRLLDPRPPDKRVGVRDMDVRDPGSGVPGIADTDLHGVLKLGGALKVPREVFTDAELAIIDGYDKWAEEPDPHPFQVGLAAFLNLPDDIEQGGGPDPVITAPIYARWHALTKRLLSERDGTPIVPDDNWVHELNLDPRFRVAAGFGTRVVQDQQERFMEAAWEQIGDVLAANRQIRFAQVAKDVAALWHTEQLAPMAAAQPGRVLTLTAPVQRHVIVGGTTVVHRRADSLVPAAATSAALRRMMRPGSRLIESLPFDATVTPGNLIERMNGGAVSPAPPRPTPPGVVTTDEIADGIVVPGVPPIAADLLRRFPRLATWVLVAAVVVLVLALVLLAVGLVPVAIVLAVIAAALFALWWLLVRWQAALAGPDAIRPGSLTPGAVDRLPRLPGFTLTPPGAGVTFPPGADDSDEGKRFKDAIAGWHELYGGGAGIEAERPKPDKIDLVPITGGIVAALDPNVAVPGRIWGRIRVPGRITAELDDTDFGEVMAYPVIDVPMYEPLKKLSDELFLPNVKYIAQNSITVLETNQRFIESYLVGLNHEFGRELLWREYPTDQRGSYFRQFWDPRGAITPPGMTPEQRREKLRDIPPINNWLRRSKLGTHDNREPVSGTQNEEIVLVIRGELLKRYPNTVIYAQAALWQPDAHGDPDPSKERKLAPVSAAEEKDPPPDRMRMPLYEAKIGPDITFFGFDLTSDEAKGDDGDVPNARPGWFFVLRERPGEPRFGFDMEREAGETIQTVNDLAWPDVGTPAHGFVSATALSPLPLAPLGLDDDEKKPQRDDDVLAVQAPVSAARWAYLLYQAPVMVAIHAAEMLKKVEQVEDDGA